MNNNPTGRNQYTGSLRNKSSNFYHGTQNVFKGSVKKSLFSDGAYASSNLKEAKFHAGKRGRLLQVAVGKASRVFDPRMGTPGKRERFVEAPQRLRIVKVLPTLHKPSRRTY